jgi:hypothetical protein
MNGMDALFSACNEVTTLRLVVDGEKAKADPVRRASVATTFIMVTEYRKSKSGRISIVLSRGSTQVASKDRGHFAVQPDVGTSYRCVVSHFRGTDCEYDLVSTRKRKWNQFFDMLNVNLDSSSPFRTHSFASMHNWSSLLLRGPWRPESNWNSQSIESSTDDDWKNHQSNDGIIDLVEVFAFDREILERNSDLFSSIHRAFCLCIYGWCCYIAFSRASGRVCIFCIEFESDRLQGISFPDS